MSAARDVGAIGIRFLIAYNCMRWREIFEGLSQDGSRVALVENLPLLFKGRSIVTPFSKIHIDVQDL
jgi:hypothetical protein